MRAFLILGVVALGGCGAITPDAERTVVVPAPAVGAREPQVCSSGGLDIILGGRVNVGAQAR